MNRGITGNDVAPMNIKRTRHGAAALGNHIFVAGDYDASSLNSAENYDPIANARSRVALMKNKRSEHCVIVL